MTGFVKAKLFSLVSLACRSLLPLLEEIMIKKFKEIKEQIIDDAAAIAGIVGIIGLALIIRMGKTSDCVGTF